MSNFIKNDIQLNTIYYGDSYDLFDIVPNNSIDLIFTSPPYAKMTKYGDAIDTFSPETYNDWFVPIINKMYNSLKNTGSFILNINDNISNLERSIYVYELVVRIKKETGFQFYDRYIWYKKSGLPTGGQQFRPMDRIEYLFHFVKDVNSVKSYIDRIREPYAASTLSRMQYDVGIHDEIDENGKTKNKKRRITPNKLGKVPDNVFRFPTAGILKNKGAKHPAPFHPDMPEYFIKWLTDENDIVLDPFIGTGTTAFAAKKLNRKYIGFEKNDNYKSYIENRLNSIISSEDNSFF
jgi:site-specific DNA-methyltransferase (adenine-specific)/site-specific DNA-methyltransferase (cytosine-N4-specific)